MINLIGFDECLFQESNTILQSQHKHFNAILSEIHTARSISEEFSSGGDQGRQLEQEFSSSSKQQQQQQQHHQQQESASSSHRNEGSGSSSHKSDKDGKDPKKEKEKEERDEGKLSHI